MIVRENKLGKQPLICGCRNATMKLLVLVFPLLFAGPANAQSGTPPPWSASGTYAPSNLVVGSDTNIYRAVHASTTSNHPDPTKDIGSYWELFSAMVPTALKLGVGQRFSTTLEAAWRFIQHATISYSSPVTINIITTLGPFAESNIASTLSLNHAFGSHIKIVGDNKANIHFSFAANVNGFSLDQGHSFGSLSGISVQGTGTQDSGLGLHVLGGSTLNASNLDVHGFHIDLLVEGSSKAWLSGLVLGAFNAAAAQASTHSFLSCGGASINGTSSGKLGLLADSGSTILAPSCSISNVTLIGFQVLDGSVMEVQGAHATNCGTGFEADAHSTLNAVNGSSTMNLHGFTISMCSYINASGITLSGNGVDFYSPNSGMGGGPAGVGRLTTDGSWIDAFR
jgi:hypothetical protein